MCEWWKSRLVSMGADCQLHVPLSLDQELDALQAVRVFLEFQGGNSDAWVGEPWGKVDSQWHHNIGLIVVETPRTTRPKRSGEGRCLSLVRREGGEFHIYSEQHSHSHCTGKKRRGHVSTRAYTMVASQHTTLLNDKAAIVKNKTHCKWHTWSQSQEFMQYSQ